ncbi:hypothetical protein ScPMuIL_009525 [Solemya velum]
MVLAKKWVLRQSFEGEPMNSNVEMVVENISDDLKEGELLVEAVFLTVDPYMKIFPIAVGSIMFGEQVAKVIAGKNEKFPMNSHVFGKLGWRSHTVVSEVSQLEPVPDMGDLPLSTILGVMGMPGMTAYFGVMDSCDPKPGNTFVVNSAAGAVGSIAGQIAKLKGCTVIGFAGTSEKCKWLKDDLGFDVVFNYKEIDVAKALADSAPDGVDCFFDNVGGEEAHKVFEHMNVGGKVAICGCISGYNNKALTGSYPLVSVWNKRVKMQGVSGWGCADRWPEAQSDMLQWIKQGKVKYRETVTEGIENMAEAFIGLFTGSHTGKAIIKA